MSRVDWSDSMRILVTGGAGFIGSCFVRYMLQKYDDVRILNLDALTYAGNLENLAGIERNQNYRFVRGDICSDGDVMSAFAAANDTFDGPVDAVVHFAAESHVDRSIDDPAAFLRTNVMGTETMLRQSRMHAVSRFVHISTDEVYGSLRSGDEPFNEDHPVMPNSPYAASKASADLLARACFSTYGFPVLVTRCSNNYGPYQFPEKLIPLMVSRALEGKSLPIYGDGTNIRDWVHVDDHVRGIDAVLRRGVAGEVYNIGGHSEMRNIDVVRAILGILGKPESLVQYVKDRPGHDYRYAIDTGKIERELGWKQHYSFEDGITSTVEWYAANADWISRVRSSQYREYYDRMYEHRDEWIAGH